MSVRLRLTRQGAHKSPFYRVVAADIRMPRDGRFLEILGTYDPRKDPAEIKLDEQKVMSWLGKGATPTDTVKQLIIKSGIYAKIKEGQAS
jgi:small subunit ribosomal protein S16